ncbi:hypothetical protein [Amycolatopsis sp. lyj-109]|uniref:non-homologous end-joining DNA ligase LigD n=1 Tax=Amycolatopsis sp. lyj-109 TaxID=2789287 RepID=UPI003979DA25
MFHTWLSTVDAPDRPDRLVLDLDPPDGTPVAELRAVARRVGAETPGLRCVVGGPGSSSPRLQPSSFTAARRSATKAA